MACVSPVFSGPIGYQGKLRATPVFPHWPSIGGSFLVRKSRAIGGRGISPCQSEVMSLSTIQVEAGTDKSSLKVAEQKGGSRYIET